MRASLVGRLASLAALASLGAPCLYCGLNMLCVVMLLLMCVCLWSRYAMSCYVMIIDYVMACHAMACNVIFCRAMLCFVMVWNFMSVYARLCYVSL